MMIAIAHLLALAGLWLALLAFVMLGVLLARRRAQRPDRFSPERLREDDPADHL